MNHLTGLASLPTPGLTGLAARRRRIAVIGGGAAGTIAAVHLLRAAPRNCEVVIIDRDGSEGGGAAYATEDPLHLLNVPACRMGAIAGEPDHFLRWLRRDHPATGEGDFVPRAVYGRYLRELLDEAASEAPAGTELRRVQGDVIAIGESSGARGPLELRIRGPRSLDADRIVLALGPLPPADPVPVPEELRLSGAYAPDPWAPDALDDARRSDSVLLLGTGLTAVDLALTLTRDDTGPAVTMLSRHGLLPRVHRSDVTAMRPFALPSQSGRLDPLVARVYEEIGMAAHEGRGWRDVIDSLRPATPALWRSLQVEEKRRFLRGLQRYWDVHRFRTPPEAARRIDELRRSGRVRVEAAGLAGLRATDDGVAATVRRADGGTGTIRAGAAVNCTGFGPRIGGRRTPALLRDLLDCGFACVDELGIGLDVDPEGRLIGASGTPSSRISVVGALRKGVEWEATGITEIREHAAAAARLATAAGQELAVA